MENKYANEPAFPLKLKEGEKYSGMSNIDGLSKREYFAGLAMQSAISDVHVQFWMKTDSRYNGENFAEVVAVNSCEFADALLKQLNNSQ